MKKAKKEKFSKSIMYLFISQGVIKIFGLLYSLYLINNPNFGDKGNAIYLSGYQIFVFMLTFSSIGVPNAVSHFIAESNDHKNISKIFKSAIFVYVLISILSSLILYCFADFIAKQILGIDCISYNLKLFAPLIIITTLESIYIGFFNGIKQMKITAKIQVIEQVIKTVFTIIFVQALTKKTNDPEILSLGATAGVVISIIISFCICYLEKRNTKIYAKDFCSEEIRYKDIIWKMLKFSIPISIGAMLVGINKNCDSFTIMNILSQKIGKDESQKIYGIIASKVDVLIVLPLAFNMTFSIALVPNISEARKRNDYNTIKNYIENAIFMSLSIGMICFLGLFYFSKEIFNLLYSNSQSGVEFLKLASISVIFSCLNQTFIGILQSFEKNNISMLSACIGTLIKILLNLIFINQESIYKEAIILSTIISNVIMCLINFKSVKKQINFKFKRYFIILGILGFCMVFIIRILYQIFIFINIYEKIAFIIAGGIGIVTELALIIAVSTFFNLSKLKK